MIVPNWNGEAFIAECLESVRAQTYEPLEAIVVDDASTDGSPELVARDFPEMRLIRLPRNSGFACAANSGIAAARGEIIALLNNDAVASPDWARELVEALNRHPGAGSAASKILLTEHANTLHSAGDVFLRSGVPDSRGVWERDCGQYEEEVEVFGACAAAAAYRRAMLDQTGAFDEAFFMYCEDVDLAFRAQLAGYPCVYAPRAVATHRLSASGGGKLASYYCGRNFVWVLARDLPAAAWRRYWPVILATQLRLAAQALWHLGESAARARLRGQIVGLLSAPRLIAQRPALHRARRATDSHLVGLLT